MNDASRQRFASMRNEFVGGNQDSGEQSAGRRCRVTDSGTPVEDLAAQALGLPPEDRAKLVERLLASFEPKSPAQAAWLVLAARRRDEVRSGKAKMVPGDEALARVRARIG